MRLQFNGNQPMLFHKYGYEASKAGIDGRTSTMEHYQRGGALAV
jgi:hypothetical protein